MCVMGWKAGSVADQTRRDRPPAISAAETGQARCFARKARRAAKGSMQSYGSPVLYLEAHDRLERIRRRCLKQVWGRGGC